MVPSVQEHSMSTPQLSVVPAEAPASTMSQPAPRHGAMELHIPAGTHVHVHLGGAPATLAQPAAASRRSPVALALAGLALLGGGYLVGTRSTAARNGGDGSGFPTSASVLPPAPEAPSALGDIPQALREQLARPPVVTPPPGTPSPVNRTAPGAPARNPFGLSN